MDGSSTRTPARRAAGRTVSRESAGGTQSAERVLAVLSQFTDSHAELRVSEVVAATGLGQSTVSRLLGALAGLGFVVHDERSGLYAPGPEVVRLATVALNRSPVHQRSRQVAQNLAFSLNLGANVAERQGDKLTYLCNFEGPRAPRSSTLVGRNAPLHATALGKALLWDFSRVQLEELLGSAYVAHTPQTITDIDELVAALEKSRARGYATELEELAFGRACVAAPVRDRAGTVVGALSVSGPLSVINLPEREQEIASAVIEAADQISSGLGFDSMAGDFS